MPEMQEEAPSGQSNRVLDEFLENAAKLNDGLSGVMVAALRMQMLMLEDARNMMPQVGAAIDATGGRGENGSDI